MTQELPEETDDMSEGAHPDGIEEIVVDAELRAKIEAALARLAPEIHAAPEFLDFEQLGGRGYWYGERSSAREKEMKKREQAKRRAEREEKERERKLVQKSLAREERKRAVREKHMRRDRIGYKSKSNLLAQAAVRVPEFRPKKRSPLATFLRLLDYGYEKLATRLHFAVLLILMEHMPGSVSLVDLQEKTGRKNVHSTVAHIRGRIEKIFGSTAPYLLIPDACEYSKEYALVETSELRAAEKALDEANAWKDGLKENEERALIQAIVNLQTRFLSSAARPVLQAMMDAFPREMTSRELKIKTGVGDQFPSIIKNIDLFLGRTTGVQLVVRTTRPEGRLYRLILVDRRVQ